MYGFAGLVDGINRRLAEELGEKAAFLATGGLAGDRSPHCETQSTRSTSCSPCEGCN